jgi:anti-sigma factor RsiW
MKVGRPAEKQMIAYLLGELSEPDRLTFEQSCLDNDAVFEELLAMEAELTDDYVSGALTGAQRAVFEARLLKGANGAETIELSRLITRQRSARSRMPNVAAQAKHAFRSPLAWLATPGQWFGFPLAAAAVLVVAIGLGFLLWKRQQPNQSAGKIAPVPQSASSAPDTSSPQIAEEQKASVQTKRPTVIATFLIIAGGERDSGNVNDIRISPGADRLRFRVNLGSSDYVSYQASLKPIDGEGLRPLDHIKIAKSGTATTLLIELVPGVLPEGDSMLTVSGLRRGHTAPEVVGKYFVRRTK